MKGLHKERKNYRKKDKPKKRTTERNKARHNERKTE